MYINLFCLTLGNIRQHIFKINDNFSTVNVDG